MHARCYVRAPLTFSGWPGWVNANSYKHTALYLDTNIEQSVGKRSDIGQIPCNRPTCQPRLAHDRSLCPFISGTRVRFCGELLFLLLFFPFFFSLPSYSSTCISFFPLLFLSSSNFFLPFPPAFLPFFLSTILFPFVFFLFYFLFPPFCCFSFSLSSLYFIFLISSSFSSPLSFSFFLFLFFLSRP